MKAQVETSSSNDSDPLWKNLWSLQIQPKAKIFLWRAAWDILPHGYNLSKKGVQNVGNCIRCGLQETNSHVMKDCQWSRYVWMQALDPSDIPPHGSFCEWLGLFMNQRSQKEVKLFGVCAWQILCARNDLCFEKIFISPEHCYMRASELLLGI